MAGEICTGHVTQFDGSNFQGWKFQLRSVFVASGIDGVVNGVRRKPVDLASAAGKVWVKNDAKAMFLISWAMEYTQLECLLSCVSSKEM